MGESKVIAVARPYVGEEEKRAVLAVLESGILAQGSQVKAFEEAFARYCGTRYAVATSSGTTALHLALLAHGIGPGDEVITSPFSFIATANAILYAGAKPVFADIEPDTFNLDPGQTEQMITPKTKAVMPVHLYGHLADMAKFLDIARRHHLVLIEDACQAHGAEYNGRKAGSFATACFSFYPTKNITSGEGGMVTTDDPDVADRVRILRNHGMRQRYHHEMLGYNYRMTDVHAAIGLTQLGRLDKFNDTRIANAAYLTSGLPKHMGLPKTRSGAKHVFHQYTVRVPRGRDILKEKLLARGVESAIYYPIPIHRQKLYMELFPNQKSYPVTEKACAEVLSLPVHPGLSRKDLDTIISEAKTCLDEAEQGR